jgi:hypothetical protein
MISFQSFRERLASTLESIESAILDLWRKTDLTEFRNDPHSQFCPDVHEKVLALGIVTVQALKALVDDLRSGLGCDVTAQVHVEFPCNLEIMVNKIRVKKGKRTRATV